MEKKDYLNNKKIVEKHKWTYKSYIYIYMHT